MKRYSLFYGSRYYPNGGMGDFKLSDDDVNVVIKKIWEEDPDFEWLHIFDNENMITVLLYEEGAEIWDTSRRYPWLSKSESVTLPLPVGFDLYINKKTFSNKENEQQTT